LIIVFGLYSVVFEELLLGGEENGSKEPREEDQ